MLTSNDNTLHVDDMLKENYPMLEAQTLKEIFIDATITARYYYANNWYKVKTNSFKNGEIEGQNHVGSYNEGRWSVNDKENSLSVEWDGYWEDWTGIAYKVKDEVMFYDWDTGNWRMTLTLVEQGIYSTEI